MFPRLGKRLSLTGRHAHDASKLHPAKRNVMPHCVDRLSHLNICSQTETPLSPRLRILPLIFRVADTGTPTRPIAEFFQSRL
jgi:hypothetical protein